MFRLCFLMEHEIFGDKDCTWFHFRAHYHEQFATHATEETKSRKASHVFSQLSFPFTNLHGCHWNIGLGKMFIWVFPFYHMETPEQAFWPTQYLHVKQYQDFRVALVLGMWLAPSCWISVSAKRRVDGTLSLRQSATLVGSRQARETSAWFEIETYFSQIFRQ